MRRPNLRLPLLVLPLGLSAGLAGLPAGQPAPSERTRLLVYRDAAGEHPVRTAADWARRRQQILAAMQQVMGRLPPDGNKVPLNPRYTETVRTPKYVRKKLTFAAGKGDRVPAYLLLPRGRAGRRAAVLCLHSTNGKLGKGEPAGVGAHPGRPYAAELAERGYVTLAPDYPSFGEYPYDFAKSPFASGSMKAVWNNRVAIDFLQSLPEVDPGRIGCVGHSLGGHNTMFTAAFDRRVKALVSNCGFTSFPKYYKGDLRGWTSARYMPRITTVYGRRPGKVPFDFPEVVAAFAPRAFLAIAPLHDDNFEVSGVKDCIRLARPVYELFGAGDRLAALYPDAGHAFPPAARRAAYAWFDRWLGGGPAESARP
jgi:dienelactone hydrolase